MHGWKRMLTKSEWYLKIPVKDMELFLIMGKYYNISHILDKFYYAMIEARRVEDINTTLFDAVLNKISIQ